MAPLESLRVVELGGEVSSAYCGKLFADFGAEVVKVIRPDDSSAVLSGAVHLEDGSSIDAYQAWLDINKSRIAVDPFTLSDGNYLRALLADADVLIDARRHVEYESSSLRHSELQRLNPRLCIAAIDWFGEYGPYSTYRATDASCWAMAGLAKLVGPKEGPPVVVPGYPAQTIGGLTAFNGVMARLLGATGGARRLSVSIHEANIVLAEYQVALGHNGGIATERLGLNRFAPNFPLGIYPCKQGWLGITVVTPAQWKDFCALLDMRDAAANSDFLLSVNRIAAADELEPAFKDKLLTKTAEEWFELGRARRLPFVIVPSISELLEQGQHRGRGAFGTVVVGKMSFLAPVLPQKLMTSPPASGGRLRPIVDGNLQWKKREHKTIEGNGPEDGPPMMGVRVIDLTMGWAGPLVTRQLADLGADIIKVEACQYPDWWRGTDFRPAALHDRLYEKRPPFLVMNRNKRGITLDLTSAEGVELLKKLVAGADAVIENYSSEVLTKLGISYDVLCGIKPDLVMLSMPAFGTSGKWADVRAYGSTLEHASALPSVVGVDGWPPTSSHLALGDPIGGLNATAALLVGLFHRRQTGHGQRIDMSQVECLFPLVAPWIIEQSLSGKVSARRGNRHKLFAPQGCYQCSGIDQWVVISVTTDAEWVTLAKMIDSSALATDKDLKTAQGRQAAHDHIDLILTAWTRSRRAQNVVHDFQQAGICAAVVQSPFELVDDRHLAAREYWQFIDRRISGSNQPHPSFPVRFELGPIKVKSAAPLLGQHNEEVLAGVGVERDRISALRLAGIVGEEATPAHLRSAQAAQT